MKLNLIVAALIASLVLSLGLLVRVGITNYKLKNATRTLNSQLQRANLEKGQALTLVGEANDRVVLLEQGLQDSINDLGLQVTRYAELEAKYQVLKRKKGQVRVEYYPGDPVAVECNNIEFTRGLYYEAVTDKTLAAVEKMAASYKDDRLTATCTFSPIPNRRRELPFLFTYSLNFRMRARLVETISPTGAINHFIQIHELNPKGEEKGELTLTQFEVIVDDQRAERFHWFNPKLDVGGIGTVLLPEAEFKPGASLGISLVGYGKTQNDLIWRFGRLSFDLMEKPGIGFTPALYNIGIPLPVISDIWLGPHVGWMFPEGGYVGLLVSSQL